MASYYYDSDYEMDGVTGVNKWEAADGFASYNSVSGGSDYCNSNDVGYELSSYETPTAGFFSSSTPAYHDEFDSGSEATWDFRMDRHNYKLNLDQPAPQFGTCQRPSQLAPYAPPHLRSCSTQRQVLPSYHNTSRETHTTRMRQVPQALNCQGMNYYHGSVPNSDFEHWHDNHCDDSSNYPAAYNDDSYVRNSDNCDVKHDYWVPEITSMRNIEHEIDFRDVAPNEGVKIAAGNVFDTCFESDLGHSPSMHNTTAPTGFHAKLDLCVKRHELCVQEHELWVQEHAIIRKDMNSLIQRINQLIEVEEKKCRKLEVPHTGLEGKELGTATILDDDVVVMANQSLGENELNLASETTGRSEKQSLGEADIVFRVAFEQEKERGKDLSVGLKRAMRCLEVQRKFWAIRSLMSVIPAAPVVQIIDPFLADSELKNQYWHFNIEPSDVIHMVASKDQGFLGMGRNNLRFAAWTELLKVIEADMICSSWIGIWRPPDLLFRHWKLGSSIVGFWFNRGRPPDIWAFPHVHCVASRTKPFKRGWTDAFARTKLSTSRFARTYVQVTYL